MKSKAIDVWVGLFVLAGIAGLLFLALKAGNLASFSTEATYRVNARFDNIGGLKPRAPVKSAGVVVGRVAAIRFDDTTYNAVADIDLESRYKFPKDSSAKILTAGLLGEQYLGLEAGGDPKMLANNDRITNTQSAVILENLISQFLFNKAAEGSSDSKDKQ
jgi:phospholipid/cholesterol/gamma-HCH transport system substrate-binding protein